jgi:hypothetical protein
MRRWLGGIVIVGLLVSFCLGYLAGKHSDDARVPNLLGLGTQHGGQAAAREALAAAGLRVGKVVKRLCAPDENGLVVSQSMPAGTAVPKNSTVNISIGEDPTHLISIFVDQSPDPCLPGEQEPAGQPLGLAQATAYHRRSPPRVRECLDMSPDASFVAAQSDGSDL